MGYLMLFLALLINSGITVAFKFASNISYIQLLFFISMIGTVTSAFIMFAEGTQAEVRYYFTYPKPFAFMLMWAILVYTLLELIFGYTTHYVSASLSAVVYRTFPLMLIAMAPFVLKERISNWSKIGVVIGFSGLVSILFLNGGLEGSLTELPFVALLLLGAFFDAICSISSKRYYYDIYSSVFMYNLLSFAIFLPLAFLTGNITLSGISMGDWVAILFLGVFQNVLLTYAFVGSFRVTDTAVASNLYLLTPFLTIIISYIILKESMLLSYFIIAATVMVGALIQYKYSERSTFTVKNKCGNYDIYDITPVFVGTKDKRLYEAMKGEGRVLAFVIKKGKVKYGKKEEEIIGNNSILKTFSKGENPCMFFTLRSKDITFMEGDIEFISKLTGFNEKEDLIFLGAGDPDRICEEFSNLYDKLRSYNSKNENKPDIPFAS